MAKIQLSIIMKINKLRFRLLEALDNLVARVHWFFSEERHNPYRCPICGGTAIRVRAWVRPNYGNHYVGDCEDNHEDDCDWCETCEKKVHACTTSWFKRKVNAWWSQTDFQEMERITGFHQSDFDPEDGFQDFVDACNAFWHALSDEQKINLWNER